MDLSELDYLLYSGSDRIGALDFQESPEVYVKRHGPATTLQELLASAQRVEEGIPLSPALDAALLHGTSIGGARPKALLESEDAKFIAKFASSSDTRDVVKAEFLAMRMARLVGLEVSDVSLEKVLGKDVLLIRRFDREVSPDGWRRHQVVSALTILGLDEMMARYASYPALAEHVRHGFYDPASTLRELFSRMVFNVLCGNTDDHARNHAAFWNGKMLRLTPAYDICPQPRSGNEASQAMLITETSRASTISTCIETAHHFLLDESQARQIVDSQIEVIHAKWNEICEEAQMDSVQRQLLWGRQFLNPYSLR
jgi:serine/threonine-protein kinase HipA